ncbi:E3 ubiquitin-protein ligase RNF8-like protein [Leptotrombidium deliense]|uniref:E3 ubiquitin-protein ligase RNF8-like protein n=1 Tax=Leptotrombidium deliense TaxID=299467 RepID=A0A443RXW4_9ACAR|nr:E3 ubiquitin-protein ligase RNF8-like protein [Leptotrombidium deliense]
MKDVDGESKERSEIAASEASASVSGLQAKRKYQELDSEITCPICSELFIEPVHVSCSHTFCNYCIERWKRNPNSRQECPVCRKPIKHVIREIVVENLIDKIVGEMDAQEKQRRVDVIETRKQKLEELQNDSSTADDTPQEILVFFHSGFVESDDTDEDFDEIVETEDEDIARFNDIETDGFSVSSVELLDEEL